MHTEEKKETSHNEGHNTFFSKLSKHAKWLIISGFVISLLAIAAISVPTKTQTYQVEVAYEDVEYYTEKEPYTAQEAYTIQVPYEVQEPYERQEAYTTTETYTDTVTSSYANSNNYCDSEPGCICTSTNWFFGYCNGCQCTQTDQVEKTRPITAYRTVTDYKTVTKYREETQYRTVTKYKDVQKNRPVIKTKMEDRYKEVNWLLGFNVPWRAHIPMISE